MSTRAEAQNTFSIHTPGPGSSGQDFWWCWHPVAAHPLPSRTVLCGSSTEKLRSTMKLHKVSSEGPSPISSGDVPRAPEHE